MKLAAFCVSLLIGASVTARAAGEEELVNAEKSWAAAVVARDFAALERIFTDDLIYAHATGAVESKAEYIGRLRSGKLKYDSLRHENIRVAVHGDSAVTHSSVQMTGASNGENFSDHLMMLHCWVKQAGRWRLAAHQTTNVP